MIPINERLAASAALQSAGLTRQSAARRFWLNRFRTGGPRLQVSGVNAPQRDVPDDKLFQSDPFVWDGDVPRPRDNNEASLMIAPQISTQDNASDPMGSEAYTPKMDDDDG